MKYALLFIPVILSLSACNSHPVAEISNTADSVETAVTDSTGQVTFRNVKNLDVYNGIRKHRFQQPYKDDKSENLLDSNGPFKLYSGDILESFLEQDWLVRVIVVHDTIAGLILQSINPNPNIYLKLDSVFNTPNISPLKVDSFKMVKQSLYFNVNPKEISPYKETPNGLLNSYKNPIKMDLADFLDDTQNPDPDEIVIYEARKLLAQYLSFFSCSADWGANVQLHLNIFRTAQRIELGQRTPSSFPLKFSTAITLTMFRDKATQQAYKNAFEQQKTQEKPSTQLLNEF